MGLQAKAGFTGLLTNVAETLAPAGALIEAENVVIRKAGAVEARDGVTLLGTVSGGAATYGFSWRAKDFFVRNNGSNVFDWRDTAGGTYQYTDLVLGAMNPQPLRRDIFSRAEARANLYLPYDSGVLKMETDAGPWRMAGLPPFASIPSAQATATGTVWLVDPGQVAYRLVARRTDANGAIVKSIPTGAIIVQNSGGGTSRVALSIVAPTASLALFDELELHRTRTFPLSVTPDDEMQLVAVIPSQAGMATGLTFYDEVAPTARGATIYTAPSRGGIAQQNERPPAAALSTLFRGSLFFGNVRGPARTKFSRKWAGPIATATGIGQRTYTGNITTSTNTALLMSSTTGLERGMVVTDSGAGYFPANTYVTAISGTTVTFSANSTATLVGASLIFLDAVNVGGTWLPGYNYDAQVSFFLFGLYVAYSVTPPEVGTPPFGTLASPGDNTYVVESLSRASGGTHEIKATHGGEYSPPLPTYASAAKPFVQDTLPGAIYWSKTDEPEHVAPGNFAYVGDQRKAILGLAPTRDALFILKEDGVFRLTGVNGVWRIDPFDPHCFCVLPMSVQNLNGLAMFLSAEGVVELDDGGVALVSRPINDQVKLTIDQVLNNFRSTGFYEVTGSQGASYSAVFDRENEYTLMRSSTDNHLVYNADTKAWTTWRYYAAATESLANRALFAFTRTGRVVYALGSTYYGTILSTAAGANYSRYDRLTNVTVNSYGAGIATLSAAITALEDDIIEDSNDRYWRITADVTASASVPVELKGGTASMGTGAAFLYRALRCKVVATGYTEPGLAQKCWGSAMTAWQRLQGAVLLKYGYQSSQSPTWAEEDAPSSVSVTVPGAIGNGYTDYALGFSATGRVPSNSHARAWLLRFRVRWAQAFGGAQLEAMGVDFTPMIPGSHHQVVP